MSTNPLMSIVLEPPYATVTSEHVLPAVQFHIVTAREKLRAIASLAAPLTYDNVLRAFDESTRALDWTMAVVGHLEAVMNSPALREAYNQAQPLVSEFYAQIPLDPELWAVVKRYSETEHAASLQGPARRHLSKTLDAFKRQGAELDTEAKQRLTEIASRLSELTTKFSQNVLDSHAAFERIVTDERELSGIPESARLMARENAARKNLEGWRFTLQAPSFLAVLTYADDRALRESLWQAYNACGTRAPFDNRDALQEILALRHEQARLLGFADFADYVLADRMAHNGKTAWDFVENLREKTEPFFASETRELQQFRSELEGPEAPALAPWDVGYYAEKLRRARFDFDEEALRPYFAVESVLQGMFEVASRVFSIQVTERLDAAKYHADVRSFSILDHDGSELCQFVVDLYPRENKRDGAWMNGILAALPSEGPHVGLFCANVTPPTSLSPALMTFREVETLFHEFGHLLHHALSRVEILGMIGTRVAWDFVELPSQIMENWCSRREALDLFAKHHVTGEPMPEELFARMKRARTFREATAQMRQLAFASVDLALHRTYYALKGSTVVEYAREIMSRFAATPLPTAYAMIASFNHLFSDPVGYAAGYYSYKWAEVLDADAFTRFESEGVFNSETGRDFRDKVLSRGDSDDPAALFRSFMGRDASVDALLRRSGLASATASANANA
ncbi:MAG: M3 family metallopeptidase [Deltaproteobacteria bacterium]|nr:M3 family metallopeptidase [Deltaproteobacteria bacterium]